MLVTPDRWLESKVPKKLSKIEVQKTLEKKRLKTRITPDPHARFMIIDDEQAVFLSTDLQTDSLTGKCQYLFWTNNKDVIQKCVNCFDNMWNAASPYDLIKEIDELEKKRKPRKQQDKTRLDRSKLVSLIAAPES